MNIYTRKLIFKRKCKLLIQGEKKVYFDALNESQKLIQNLRNKNDLNLEKVQQRNIYPFIEYADMCNLWSYN